MELDLVAAMAETVEEFQLRRESMCQPSLLDGVGAAEFRAIGGEAILCPAGAVHFGGLHQRAVGGKEVVVFQRRRLIQRFGGIESRLQNLMRGHDASPGSGESIKKSEEHTSELQSLMRISYAIFC